MSKYIIKAKNEQYTGESHGVSFVNGQAETENDWAAVLLEENGYTVEKVEEKQDLAAAEAEAAAAAAAAEAEAAAKAAAEAEAKAAEAAAKKEKNK